MSIVRTDACTDAEAGANSPDRLTYAKMAAAQAALLVDQSQSEEIGAYRPQSPRNEGLRYAFAAEELLNFIAAAFHSSF